MIYSLTDLKRYNNKIKCKSESVSEHMYFCAYILLKLREHLKIEEYDFSMLLQYVLIHDVGEIVSGDLPYNVKAENPALRQMVDKIEDDYIETLGFGHIIDYISLQDKQYLKKTFKLVDTLQVIQYCKNELLLGNASSEMKTIYDTAIDICQRIIDDLYEMKIMTRFNLEVFIKNEL